MEDERAVGVAARPPSRQGLGNGRRDGEDAPDQRELGEPTSRFAIMSPV